MIEPQMDYSGTDTSYIVKKSSSASSSGESGTVVPSSLASVLKNTIFSSVPTLHLTSAEIKDEGREHSTEDQIGLDK